MRKWSTVNREKLSLNTIICSLFVYLFFNTSLHQTSIWYKKFNKKTDLTLLALIKIKIILLLLMLRYALQVYVDTKHNNEV